MNSIKQLRVIPDVSSPALRGQDLLVWLADLRGIPWSCCPWLQPTIDEHGETGLLSVVDLLPELDEARLAENVLVRWGPVLPSDVDACARRENFLKTLINICGSQGPDHWTRDIEQCHRWLPEEVYHALTTAAAPRTVAGLYDVQTTAAQLAEQLGWTI